MIPGIGGLATGSIWSVLTNKNQYAWIIVGPADLAAATVAAVTDNGTRILVYKDGMGVDNNAFTGQNQLLGGVDRATARANNWILKDAGGAEIVQSDGMLLADVGSAGYRAAFAANVRAWIISNGGHGVFLDNLLAQFSTITFGVVPATPSAYTDATWEDAQVGFIQALYADFHSHGLVIMANTYKGGSDNATVYDQPWWTRVAPYLDSIMVEYFVQVADNRLRAAGDTINYNYFWDGWEDMIRHAQAQGSSGTGANYGTPGGGVVVSTGQQRNIMRYGRGSFLLDWNGGIGAYFFSHQDANDPWDTAWTFDSGSPLAPKTQPLTGVFKRLFRNGIIYVNSTGIPEPDTPSTSAPANTGGFLLGGTTYYYRVSAVNASGETLAGPERAYTTPAGTNTNKVTLNWTAQYDQSFVAATGYKIYRGTASGGEQLLATVGAVTSYTDSSATVPSGAMPTGNGTSPKTVDGNVIPALDALWVPGFVPHGKRLMQGVG